MEMPVFRTGGKEAKEAASKGGNFDRIPFFGLKDGEVAFVRLLTDFVPREGAAPGSTAWITVDMHSMVSTRPAPSDLEEGQKWPKSMGCVCRNDKNLREFFEGSGVTTSCYVCDTKKRGNEPNTPSSRNWAYAVLREEVHEDGKLAGYRTLKRIVEREDKDGNKTRTEEPALVKINLGWKNFFAKFDAVGQYRGTVLDRDFRIKRNGSGPTDTDYEVVALDPIPNADPETAGEFPYVDMRNPKEAAKYGVGDYCPEDARKHPTLAEVVFEQCSDDYFDRFFDERHPIPARKGKKKGDGEGAPEAEQDKPSTEASDAQLAAMKDRVTAMAAPKSDSEAPAEAATPVAAAAGPKNFD